MIQERTFIAAKPEAIQRHLLGEIVSRFERRGLKLIGCKMVMVTEELISDHYSEENDWELTGKKTIEGYLSAGREVEKDALEIGLWVREQLMEAHIGRPWLVMVWQGAHAVELGRKTVGATNPLKAEVGTIRGDFTTDSYLLGDVQARPVRTLVHASGTVEEAEREIGVWFSEEELVRYRLVGEEVLYGDDWGREEE